MSFRIRLRCSNEKCGYAVGLAAYFPIWKEGTPETLQHLPVNLASKDYVAGHYDEKACLACRQTVPVAQGETKCPECGANEQFVEVGAACPLCGIGEMVEDKARRVCF